MGRVLPTAMVMGLIAGLLVAGYMNIFNVPVMEWAIELEGKAALAEPAGDEPKNCRSLGLLHLGAQRVGNDLGAGRGRRALRRGLLRAVLPYPPGNPGLESLGVGRDCRAAGVLVCLHVHPAQVPP